MREADAGEFEGERFRAARRHLLKGNDGWIVARDGTARLTASGRWRVSRAATPAVLAVAGMVGAAMGAVVVEPSGLLRAGGRLHHPIQLLE